jgi:hypothetical protein
MSAGAETEAGGPSVAGTPASGSQGAASPGGAGQAAAPPDAAGRLLGRLSVLPALLVTAWLLAGLPLLLLGLFTPLLSLVVSVPLAAAAVYFGTRWTPGRWPAALPVPSPQLAAVPWWAVAGVLAVAAGFGADQMIFHSQQVIIQRDPASYMQFAAWIAGHGSLPIPQARAAFGGTHHVLVFGSSAFYQVGSTVVPQFMAGLPMVLAAGFWAGGASAAAALAPLLGAGAVLTFGGLAARLAGPRWAPLAALVLALTLPEQYTSRLTLSEPLAQILFLGGLCLVIDSLDATGAGARVAALGGLALGLTLLVRIDGISDILPVIPYCGLLLLGRRRQAIPLLAGLGAGALCGALDGLVLSRPYLASISGSLTPLLAVTIVVVALTAVAVLALWNHGVPGIRGRWPAWAVAAVPFAAIAFLAVRPYLGSLRGHVVPLAREVARQGALRPIPDGLTHRLWDLSLTWVFWYVGLPAVVLGTIGAALLARRCLRGLAPAWTLPLMLFGWAIVTVLYRPAITPDHPWASRRLVPAVLPGFILLAVWASGWLTSWLRQHGYDHLIRAGAASACAVVLVLPAAITTFGLPSGDGLAFKTVYSGEIAAVNRMCAAIPRGSAVVSISVQTTRRFTEVVRGMCGDPSASIARPAFSSVQRVIRGIEQAGRQPVLLARSRSELVPYGGRITHVMNLQTRQEQQILLTAPRSTRPLPISVWMSEPGR